MSNNFIQLVFIIFLISTLNTESAELMNNNQRVIEKQDSIQNLLPTILEQLNLSLVDFEEAKDGRIATNRIITSHDGNKYVVRAYPKKMPHKCETGNPHFEIKALKFMNDHGMMSPALKKFNNNEHFLEIEDLIVSVYPYIEGSIYDRESLDIFIAQLAGEYAKDLAHVSTKFEHCDEEFIDELEFIKELFYKRSSQYKEMNSDKVFQEMINYVKKQQETNLLSATPKGIVHGDFFYENFIVHNNSKGVLIDFGDSYYGYVLTDIALAAMEFSSITEENWDLENLYQFLKPLSSWLIANHISFDLFMHVMRSLCVKFACYTVPFTKAEGEDIQNNPYRIRFSHLFNEQFNHEISKVFASVIGESK